MQVGGDLIVSATAGMQLASNRTDLFGQERLNIHMNVFIFNIKGQLALLQLFIKCFQSLDNCIGIHCIKDLGCLKHLDMGQ